MGDAAVCDGSVPLRVWVHGTGDLDTVEVVRVTPGADAELAAGWLPGRADLVATATTDLRGDGSVFDLRAYQREPYRGRRVQGWSSPIWVTRDGAAAQGG